MATTWDEIKEEFAVFGTTFTDDVIPERCMHLCNKYGWAAQDFYDEWLAWSKSKSEVDHESLEKMILDIAKAKQAAPPTNLKTPKPTQNRIQTKSPALGTPKRRLTENCLSASFTDGTDSTPARVYKSGKRTGQIVASYEGSKFTDKLTDSDKIEVKIVNDMEMRGRFQNKNRTEVILSVLERLAQMKEHFSYNELKDFSDGQPTAGDIVYGLLRPPQRANMPFLLYGDYDTSRSVSTAVLPKFPVFPGEIILATVGNPAGRSVFLDECIPPELPPLPPKVSLKAPIRLLVTAGPYTTVDTLSYEPYHDFVKKLVEEEPDVAIMVGPFVDIGHKKLSTNLDCTFSSYFNQLIGHVVKQLSGKRTRLYIIANYRENHIAGNAFPTAKYDLSSPNVTCLNDPAIIDINGIRIGISSTDILRSLSESIVNVEENMDIVQLAAQKILEQRNFYPLFPAHGDLCVRQPLLNYTMFDVRPHLFILPATVAPFVWERQRSLFVNPGTLVKGMDAGSYATINVSPFEGDSIVDATRARIVKV